MNQTINHKAMMNLTKLEGKKAKKSSKSWAKRDFEKSTNIQHNANPNTWLAEKNRDNAKNNLPSSLR